MPETKIGIGSPVKDFIKEFVKQAEEGLEANGYVPCSEEKAHTIIELNAVEIKEKGAGLKIHVLSLGGKKEGANSQTMTFFAKKKSAMDDVEARAKIAEANLTEKFAEGIRKGLERKQPKV